MKPPQSKRAKFMGKFGELLVIGGVAAEMIAAHFYSLLTAILSVAPTSSTISLCGAGALLTGLFLELIAHRS